MAKKKQIVIKNSRFEPMMNSQGMASLFSQNLPARLSYPLACMMRTVRESHDTYMAEKMKIVDRHCDRDEKGNPIKTDKNQFTFTENSESFIKEYDELLALETTIKESKMTIDLETLESAGVRLSANAILDLEPLIHFEGPVEKGKKVVPIKEKEEAV